MKKNEIESIINHLQNEIKGIESSKYIDPWLIPNNFNFTPLWKKLSFGLINKGNEVYSLAIKTYTKTSKINKLARNILLKLNVPGNIEMNSSFKMNSSLLYGNKASIGNNNKKIGSSISFFRGPSGTISLFVSNKDGKVGILSCGHIFRKVENTLHEKHKVYSPCSKFYRSSEKNAIGVLDWVVSPKKGIINKIDASFSIQNNSKTFIFNNSIDNIPGYGTVKTLQLPPIDYSYQLGDVVYKIGSSERVSFGNNIRVGEVKGLYEIDVDKHYKFERCIVVTSKKANFGIPGDSGSLIVSNIRGNICALGILFGIGIERNVFSRVYRPEYYICPLDKIVEKYNLELI